MTYLDELLALRRASVDRQKQRRSRKDVQADADARQERRDFAAALRSGSPAIVAEFKRSSPSAGPIKADADPAAVAAAYECAGAAALSVLTEPDRFKGSFADLRAARAATSLPVLCKDFVVDDYQIFEAVAEGADAILLIVAALDDATLRTSVALSRRLRIDALVEVHDEAEAARALDAGAAIVGVNNRDLRSFEVDISTALRVRRSIPSGTIVVAESGYKTAADVSACAQGGLDAVLVGEALMRERDPGRALARLRGPAS
jgi:indole-3-glycerol phosphate synthase